MKNIKYITYILSSFLLLSCGENFFDSIVEVEVPVHEPNLAVTAHLSNLDEVSIVHVTNTVGILDNNNAAPITDAKVELYGDGQLVQTYKYMELYEEPSQNGNQIRDLYLVEDSAPLEVSKNYELKVSTPTYGEIAATQILTASTPILSAIFEEEGIVDEFGDRTDEVAIKFQDKAGKKNYYLVEVAGYYEGNISPTEKFMYINHAYLSPADPISEEGGSGNLIFSDATFDGKEYELKMAAFGLEKENSLKEVIVTLYAISEDRYLYEKSLLSYQENDGNPFAEPVIIHENVSQGNGIFTMSAGDVFTIEID